MTQNNFLIYFIVCRSLVKRLKSILGAFIKTFESMFRIKYEYPTCNEIYFLISCSECT